MSEKNIKPTGQVEEYVVKTISIMMAIKKFPNRNMPKIDHLKLWKIPYLLTCLLDELFPELQVGTWGEFR